MCQFASLFHNPITGEVKIHDLNSHGNTEKKLKLDLKVWREGHYLPNGKFELRFNLDDRFDKQECEERFARQFPDFISFLNWCFEQREYLNGSLDLSSLTTLDPKVKLPEKIGSYLYLRSLNYQEKQELKKKYPQFTII